MYRPRATALRSIVAIDTVITLVVLSTAGQARAQSADAEALFEQGNRLMAESRLGEACEVFEASRRIEPRAGTLIRLGECREANHQLASAWAAYKDALARVKDPRKRDVATTHVQDIEPRLSHLIVEIADSARVDGLVVSRSGSALDPGLWNQAIPVDGGDLVVAARAPGFQDWRTPISVPEAGATLTITVPRLIPSAPIEPVVLPPPVPPISLLPVEPDEPASRWTARRKAAVGVAAAGVVSLAVAAVLGSEASSLDHGRAVYADVGLGVGTGAIAAAAALWLLGAPPDASTTALAPTVSTSGAGLAVTGRF